VCGQEDYRVKVRAILSGSSDTSASAYTVYSGVALDVGLARDAGPLTVELSFRTESREVEGPLAHLGSLEMLPLSLAAQWRPLSGGGGAYQPYIGVGASATITWEKSGALDSIDVPVHFGPVVQVGVYRRLSPRTAVSFDVRWGTLRVDLTEFDASAREVKVDPLVLGLGMAFSF
jgi:outer membrane protein W